MAAILPWLRRCDGFAEEAEADRAFWRPQDLADLSWLEEREPG